MRNLKLRCLLLCALSAAPAFAAKSEISLFGITTGGVFTSSQTDSDGWVFLDPGLYVIEVYEPAAGVASDPCGVAGGDFDTASVTIEYSPDRGVTVFDSDDVAGRGITVDVRFVAQIGRSYYHRVRVDTVGTTCFNVKFSKSEG